MRSAKLYILIGCLSVISINCITSSTDLDKESNRVTESGVEQRVDDLCASWVACYDFCITYIPCNDETSCAWRWTCLSSCDTTHYPAPILCSYP